MIEPIRTLVVDPPWLFGDKLPGKGRGAEKHYPCMSFDDLRRFPLPRIAKDAYMFLWRVASMQQEALSLAACWGFLVKTELVWVKRTKTGKRHFGMGRTVRAEHEVCLIATRGRPTVRSKSIRSVFEAPVGRHSEKPDEFYALVEQLCEGPYHELFARRQRPGWVCEGNELPTAHAA